MVIGLQPLEFADCLLDSPDFRDNLLRHEKELEKTSQQIKRIIKEVKDLLAAAKDERIDIEILKNGSTHHLLNLCLNGKMELGIAVRFEGKLKEWLMAEATTISNESGTIGDKETRYDNICISEILRNSPKGRLIQNYYKINNKLNDACRASVLEIINNHLIQNEVKMSTDLAKNISQQIIDEFDTEDIGMYYIKQKGKAAISKVSAKFYNAQRSLKSCGIVGKRTYETRLDKETKLRKEPKVTFAELEFHWTATKNYRALDVAAIQSNCSEIIKKWPQYKRPLGYKLIDIDFNNLYPEAVSISENFESFSNKLVPILTTKVRDCHDKRILETLLKKKNISENLSKAQRTLSKSLEEFNFECIGTTQTDDEHVIVNSLKQFSKLIAAIEDERDNMLDRTHDQIVLPLETFRKEHINGVRENKKKFDKKTAKFCQAQERFLNMSSKKPDNTIQEADASLGMLEREYLRESLGYVLRIQEVQERIKFEFVETLLQFISGWLVFYHYGHEIYEDAKEYMKDLQFKVQKTRDNFTETQAKAEELKAKYMDSKMKIETEYAKQGYLFLMEKKAFTAIWSKYYCTYKKQDKIFSMVQYNQISGRPDNNGDNYNLVSCTRRASDFEKRYCFDLTLEQKPGQIFTFQALSEEDRKAWVNAMDGKEPTSLATAGIIIHNEDFQLDEVGFAFVRKCIEILENRGLEEEGLYRVGGVNTKINKLLGLGVDRKKTEKERLQFFTDDTYGDLMESKTIASALKQFLRHLSEPLMTYRYHNGFIAAAKQETRMQRISDVHTLIHRLPKPNFDMLELVVRHLKAVSMKLHKNKMSVFNLGVVFGPTLLRPLEDTIASILDIKFNNVVIEILIENYDVIFRHPPNNIKPSDYLDYSTVSEPRGEQMMGGNLLNSSYHRRTSNSSNTTQPVMRVVTKSKHTDPIMSSSLQNIPNGLSIHSTTSNGGTGITKNNHHPIYDTKKSLNNMNQSTPSLIQDAHLSPRELTAISRLTGLTSVAGSGSISSSNTTNESQYITSPSLIRAGQQQNNYALTNRNNNDRSLLINRHTEALYGAQKLHHPMTYSETNLIQQQRQLGGGGNSISAVDTQSINDRINSTSSSNESVCSSSSRDLISSPYNRYNNQTTTVTTQNLYNTNTYAALIRDNNDASQNYSPKKIQRGKPVGKSKFHAGRENVRVRTLYACLAENEGELSFEPNQIITNVRPSNEPGWLEGTLAGKSGLIPENYVEVLP